MTPLLLALSLTLPPDAAADAIASTMLDASTIPSTRSRSPRCWVALERAPGGCAAELHAYARAFVEAGDLHDLDPWVLVAMAWHESRFIAWADGKDREIGILQLSPRRRDVRDLAIYSDPLYQARCRTAVGSCQREIVLHAAGILARSISKCGSEERGLAMYNGGSCESPRGLKYAARVMATARNMTEKHDS